MLYEDRAAVSCFTGNIPLPGLLLSVLKEVVWRTAFTKSFTVTVSLDSRAA